MGHLDMINENTFNKIIYDKDIKNILILGAAQKSKMLNYLIEQESYDITVLDISSWAIQQAKLEKKPITIINADALIHDNYNYDLVISFIMEHVQYQDAISLWNKITSQAKYSVFFVMENDHNQEPYEENPHYEQITEHWDTEMILSDFNNIDNIEAEKYHLIVSYTKK